MNKFPFNAAGVDALVSQLYSLSDPDLQTEASNLKMQFKTWLAAHFLLNAKQLAYLQQLNVEASNYLADQLAFALSNRLGISLAQDPPEEEDEQGKIIVPKNNIQVQLNASSGYQVSGNFIIGIEYT